MKTVVKVETESFHVIASPLPSFPLLHHWLSESAIYLLLNLVTLLRLLNPM